MAHRWRVCLVRIIAVLSVAGILMPTGNVNVAAAEDRVCQGNAAAYQAFDSKENFTVKSTPGLGYEFYYPNPILPREFSDRGLIILPAHKVSPIAYAPYARSLGLLGCRVAIALKATSGLVVDIMLEHPELQYWAIAGHGTAGKLAAKFAIALQPKIRSLILLAAPVPPKLDFRFVNLFVLALYGANDTANPPSVIEQSFSRLPGDALTIKVPGLGYYDFAYSTCIGNSPSPNSSAGGNSTALTPLTAPILADFTTDLYKLQWYAATPRGLSFGDNHFLTPGFNDSKPYPGNITVRFDQIEIPGTNPQRHWWVFTPSQVKGGIVYFSGYAVQGKAYFPLAFQLASRGHLVVIPESIARDSLYVLEDATAIIDSKLPIFSGVPENGWAVAGHSWGGLTTSTYAGCHGDKIYGAVMNSGAFLYNMNTSEVPIFQIYGAVDAVSGGVSSNYEIHSAGLYNPVTVRFLSVPGANHYQVGDYGYQPPDQIAPISQDAQQSGYADLMVEFLDSLPRKTYASVISEQECSSVYLLG